MKTILLLISLLAGVAVLRSAAPTKTSISRDAACELAISKYRQLFADKFYLNEVDHKYHACPPLDAKAFHIVEFSGGVWRLVCDPPAGFYIRATVSEDGKWVQIDSVGFSPE